MFGFITVQRKNAKKKLKGRTVPLNLKAQLHLKQWIEEVMAGISGRPSAQVPLDLHYTAFQRRVWDALRAIPGGARAAVRRATHLAIARRTR